MRSHPTNHHRYLTWATVVLLAGAVIRGEPLGTGFTYQGRLTDNGSPANGNYDFRFSLYNAGTNGTQVGSTLTQSNVVVANGVFTTALDFGSAAVDSTAFWLEIAVRPGGTERPFAPLDPRQRLTPAPSALYALSASQATMASQVADNSVTGTAIKNGTITADKMAAEQVVKSLNALRDDVLLAAGDNVNITSSGNTLTINSDGLWKLSGNSNTTAGAQFLGTTDDQPLELKVNLARAFYLQPTFRPGVVNVIGGSRSNYVKSEIIGATIGGGGDDYDGEGAHVNAVLAHYGTIAGGWANLIGINAAWATVGGGFSNRVNTFSDGSVIAGGQENAILDDSRRATISGGAYNTISDGSYRSTISGGESNTIASQYAKIGGGARNTIQDGARYATIGGGGDNFVKDRSFTGTIGGGGDNIINADSIRCTIGGGKLNSIGTNSAHSTIGGGLSNSILDNAEAGTIPGGTSNLVAGAFGFAAGRRAKANHPGAFVWADATDADFVSGAANQFAVRASGGAVFFSDAMTNSGVTLAPGSGTWSSLSDRNAKRDVRPVDPQDILARLAAVPLNTWSYRGQEASVRHLGPTAQDFHAAFHLGEDRRHIAAVDADGVALAAIQGLNEVVKDKEARIAALEERVHALEGLVAAMAVRQ